MRTIVCVCVCSIVGSVYVVNGGYRFEEDKFISLSSQSDCPSVRPSIEVVLATQN